MNFLEKKTIRYFLITLLLLLLIGIVMVYSSSYIYAKENFGSSLYFFLKQLIFTFLGLLMIFILEKTSFSFWYKYGPIINIFFVLVLCLTLFPVGLGVKLKGASRWINIGQFYFQPGEFVKFTIFFPMIYFFENFKQISILKKLLYVLSIITPLIAFIFQPDFGTFTISTLVILFICFLSSCPRKIFYSLIGLSISLVIFFVTTSSYRLQRVLTYLDPWKDPQNSGFQIIQSYLAFANGLIWGKGIGNSDEKLFYLPEAHNDFIFSIIGEEFGFLGVSFVVTLFVIFIFLGFKLAILSKERVNMIFIATVIFTLGLEAFLNMGVVLGLLPTKGLNLPFISYGGSSMLANCLFVGLVLSAFNCRGKSTYKKILFSHRPSTEKY